MICSARPSATFSKNPAKANSSSCLAQRGSGPGSRSRVAQAPWRHLATGTEGQPTPCDTTGDRHESPLTTPHSENEDNCTKFRHFSLLRARMKNEIIFTEPSCSVLHLPPEFERGTKINSCTPHGAQFRAYQLGGSVLCGVF